MSDVKNDVKQLKRYFEPKILNEYDTIAKTGKLKAMRSKRDEIVNKRMLAIDLLYDDFKQELYTQGVGSKVGSDLTTITLGAVGALSSGSTSRVLSGIQAGITGAGVSIDKNLFYEMTMPALLAEMDAQRLTVLSRIRPGLDQDVILYPLYDALRDVSAYEDAGSIPSAVARITKSSGEKAGKAEVIILEARDKAFFSKERQDRVKALLSSIDSLKDEQAIELEKNPPERDLNAEKVVKKRDSENLRATKGSVAKQALAIRVIYCGRSPEQLDSWEAAIKAIKAIKK